RSRDRAAAPAASASPTAHRPPAGWFRSSRSVAARRRILAGRRDDEAGLEAAAVPLDPELGGGAECGDQTLAHRPQADLMRIGRVGSGAGPIVTHAHAQPVIPAVGCDPDGSTLGADGNRMMDGIL